MDWFCQIRWKGSVANDRKCSVRNPLWSIARRRTRSLSVCWNVQLRLGGKFSVGGTKQVTARLPRVAQASAPSAPSPRSSIVIVNSLRAYSPLMALEHAIHEDNIHLPSYLSRHVNIGFDADDVTALINSIDASLDDDDDITPLINSNDASQSQKTSTLPHLPAEVRNYEPLIRLVLCVVTDLYPASRSFFISSNSCPSITSSLGDWFVAAFAMPSTARFNTLSYEGLN
jgi:hypothetical protein